MLEQMTGKVQRAESTVVAYLKRVPSWRWKLYGGIAAFIVIYLLWCRYGHRPMKSGQVTSAPQARAVQGMGTKAVQPKQIIVYRDKVRVVEKLGLPPADATNPQEEISSTAQIPALPHGGISATFTNMSTGQSRTEIKANAAPWFSFERGNEVALGYGVNTKGQQVIHGHYRRDICQVKGVYLTGQGEVNVSQGNGSQSEAKAMMMLNYRW